MSSMFSRTLERGSTLSKLMTASAAPVDLDGARPVPDLLSRSLDDIEKLMERGSPVSIKDLPAFIDAVKNLNGIGLDDRKFLLEKLLVFMSRSPDDSEVSTKVQQFVIDTLYKDLPHPPSGYLSVPTHASATSIQSSSHGVKYAYRSADGSNYNPLFPSLGKAGSPYARSVPSTSTTPLSALPDAGLVFDTLLKRDHFEAHPDGISSLFFAFADLVIHCIFNTSHSDWTINDTSSYLDLSVLYGNSEADVDKVRRKDGSGKLWNDVFADARVRFMPPAVCALLVLFNRNHNYIAQKIRDINERGNFDTPGVKDTMAQDDEIFHRSRLVNTGFFMQTILGDYVGAILGLVRDGLAWRLRPLETMRQMDHEFAPQGEGNVVSLEFNLLYRWHACLSAQDAEWTEAEFKKLFDGKDFGSVDIKDFERAAHKYMIPDPDVKTWTFSDLKRESDGRFKDGDLANILQNATEASAGAFKARGIPEALRVVEILGIMQARSWGTCSLNEFRKFMGLKPYKSFKEWNPDPEIHTAAATLYHDIDNLELHVGLQAEDAKKPMPGAGLCPGYTISRAILADAVCLTRGDRFLTVNFTPFNLTSWGYQDCQYNTADGSYGGMLTKLLFRTLPDHYPARSAYAHFPMLVPARARMHLRKLAKDPTGKYMWERPGKPMGLVEVTEYEDVVRVLADGAFESQGDDRMRGLAKGVRVERQMVHELLFADNDVQAWKKYFGETARRLIREKSIDHVGSPAKYVDIVKDVINLVPVHWIANEIIGLPMKTAENPSGTYREYELVEKFQDVANYIYLNAAPDNDWALRESAAHTAHLVRECVKSQLALQSPKGLIGSVRGMPDFLMQKLTGTGVRNGAFMQRLVVAGKKPAAVSGEGRKPGEVKKTSSSEGKKTGEVKKTASGEGKRASFSDVMRGSASGGWKMVGGGGSKSSSGNTSRASLNGTASTNGTSTNGNGHGDTLKPPPAHTHPSLPSLPSINTSTSHTTSNTMNNTALSPDALALSLFAAAVPTAACFAQALTNVVDFYLDEGREGVRGEIAALCGGGGADVNGNGGTDLKSSEVDERLLVYIREALRLEPPVRGVYRTATAECVLSDGRVVREGERVYVGVGEANVDPRVFGPDPQEPRYDRPAPKSGVRGVLDEGLLSTPFFEAAAPAVVRAVFGLAGVRRAGRVSRFTQGGRGSVRGVKEGGEGEGVKEGGEGGEDGEGATNGTNVEGLPNVEGTPNVEGIPNGATQAAPNGTTNGAHAHTTQNGATNGQAATNAATNVEGTPNAPTNGTPTNGTTNGAATNGKTAANVEGTLNKLDTHDTHKHPTRNTHKHPTRDTRGARETLYVDARGAETPWAPSLVVAYDGSA